MFDLRPTPSGGEEGRYRDTQATLLGGVLGARITTGNKMPTVKVGSSKQDHTAEPPRFDHAEEAEAQTYPSWGKAPYVSNFIKYALLHWPVRSLRVVVRKAVRQLLAVPQLPSGRPTVTVWPSNSYCSKHAGHRDSQTGVRSSY